jgi:hypothetical protein
MPSTRSFEPRRTGRFSSTVNLATNVLITTTLAVFICCLLTSPSHAQGPSLSLGTLTTSGSPAACNAGAGFYYYVYPNTGLALDMMCQTATVSSCSQVINGQTVPVSDKWPVTIGYLNPVGIVSGVTVAKGLIILHGGSGGTAPESFALADNYFRAGFEVVQMAWGDDWEMISDPITSGYGNIQAAACRPATLFNWVFNNLFPNVLSANSQAGMCALGDSAGSAAVAYSLAYYGAGSYLDNVELLSGPVLSDIEQGCQWKPQASSVQVCGQTNYGGGQYGCQLGGGSTWTLSPTYLSGANSSVGKWTNDNSCADANGLNQSTTGASATQWLLQSVVDQYGSTGQGAAPTFTYASTAVSGWLCRSVVANPNYACAANSNNNYNSCPNNSSPQGQIFYENIGVGNAPPHYAVYAVDSCGNAEGVGSGTVPGFYPQYFGGTSGGGGNAAGSTAITDDMVGSAPNIPAQCIRRNHN